MGDGRNSDTHAASVIREIIMKFLFLLLLIIGCGKQEGSAIDYHDNDGDQIPNYLEVEEFKKYVADVDPIGKVSGRISFNHKNGTTLNFSNRVDLKDDVLRFMAGRENSNSKDDYFSEWTKLHMETPQKLEELKLPSYSVHIHMTAQAAEPEEIFLVHDKTFRKLGNWDQYLKVELTADELNNLSQGKAYLSLQKKFYQSNYAMENSEITIRDKNNRLYLLEKGKSSILYVSKDLSLDDLLGYLKISSVSIVEEKKLFYMSNAESKPQWFIRQFENGDSVLAFTTIQDIREEFLNRFTYNKTNLVRENGETTSALNFVNQEGAQVYLRLRPSQTLRKFSEASERRKHVEGGGGGKDGNGTTNYHCTHFLRNIKSEEVVTPSLEEIFQGLSLTSQGNKFHFDPYANTQVEEKMDEKGIFWEMEMPSNRAIKLSLNPAEKSSYVITGQYDVKCADGNRPRNNSAAYSTNIEGKLIIEIESYVEKID